MYVVIVDVDIADERVKAVAAGDKDIRADATRELELVPDNEFLEHQRLERRPAQSRELQLVLDPEYL